MRPKHLAVSGFLMLSLALAACGGGATTTAPAAPVPAASPTATTMPAATATRPATGPTAAASAASASATTGTATAPPPTVPPPTVAAPSATPARATAAPTAAPAPTAAATVGPVGDGKTVTVTLKDFAITLDSTTATAGMVTFNVRNDGPSPHNFTLTLDGADRGTMTLDLKPGTYTYRCTIPGHDLLGMKGRLAVT